MQRIDLFEFCLFIIINQDAIKSKPLCAFQQEFHQNLVCLFIAMVLHSNVKLENISTLKQIHCKLPSILQVMEPRNHISGMIG